jgi:transitional endoplasmic reticulum ATPase
LIFCEDIDRALDEDRDEATDDILNTIDGIDGKTSNIVTVLTSNFVERIEPAMLRPGRLDAVIEVTAPDAKAVEKLIRYYGGNAIDPNLDLTSVAQHLEGSIPAVIAEVVKRAKLVEVGRSAPGSVISHLSVESLLSAAKTMRRQLDLLNRDDNEDEDDSPEERIADGIVALYHSRISEIDL